MNPTVLTFLSWMFVIGAIVAALGIAWAIGSRRVVVDGQSTTRRNWALTVGVAFLLVPLMLFGALWFYGLVAPNPGGEVATGNGTRTAAQPQTQSAPAKPVSSGEVVNRPPAAQPQQPQPQAQPSPAAPTKPANGGNGQYRDLNPGESIPAGTIALVEIVDHDKRTINISVGKTTNQVTEDVQGNLHTNVWSYTTDADALDGGCKLINDRKAHPSLGKYMIRSNIDGQCAGSRSTGSPAAAGNGDIGREAPDGMRIPAGTIGIFETIDWKAKTVTIMAGKSGGEFVVKNKGEDYHNNAWIGFTSEAGALRDVCAQVRERLTQVNTATFKFNVPEQCTATPPAVAPTPPAAPAKPAAPQPPATTGNKGFARLTGPCTMTDHTSDYVLEIASGEIVPVGYLVVVRQVDHVDKLDYIEAGCLLKETTFDDLGMMAVNGWRGYSHVDIAINAMCRQARADYNGSRIKGAWNYGYATYMLDESGNFTGAIPVCTRGGTAPPPLQTAPIAPAPAKPVTPPAAPTPQK